MASRHRRCCLHGDRKMAQAEGTARAEAPPWPRSGQRGVGVDRHGALVAQGFILRQREARWALGCGTRSPAPQPGATSLASLRTLPCLRPGASPCRAGSRASGPDPRPVPRGRGRARRGREGERAWESPAGREGEIGFSRSRGLPSPHPIRGLHRLSIHHRRTRRLYLREGLAPSPGPAAPGPPMGPIAADRLPEIAAASAERGLPWAGRAPRGRAETAARPGRRRARRGAGTGKSRPPKGAAGRALILPMRR